MAACEATIFSSSRSIGLGSANSRDSTDQNFPCAAAARANSWTSIAESWFCNEDVRTTMQLYAQSDQESRLEAQGKFLALLLGDKAHLLMETIQ